MLACHVMHYIVHVMMRYLSCHDGSGPVLESLMGMRALPAAAAFSLEDGVRGTNHPHRASAREEHSEEEQGGNDDRLSSLPSWTSSHKTAAQVCEEGDVWYKLQPAA